MSLRRFNLSSLLATTSSTLRSHSTMSSPTSTPAPTFPTRLYIPKHTSWPYSPSDFTRHDSNPDSQFYSMPRIGITHIDDHAIDRIYTYYESVLPSRGRVLDLCSSWISFIPNTHSPEDLQVVGLGMNKRELEANPRLCQRIVQDLNVDPDIPPASDGGGGYDSALCVVSIDYLTQPVRVLSSLKERMNPGGKVHLVISNRCFPTKVIKRWLELSEEERLELVGDYLHFAGYEEIEIITLSDGMYKKEDGSSMRVDPLWVVRGTATVGQT